MRQAGNVQVNVTKHRGVDQGVIYVDNYEANAFTTTMIDRILHTIYTRTQSLYKNKMLPYGHFLLILLVRRVFNFRWSLNSHDVLYRVSPKWYTKIELIVFWMNLLNEYMTKCPWPSINLYYIHYTSHFQAVLGCDVHQHWYFVSFSVWRFLKTSIFQHIVLYFCIYFVFCLTIYSPSFVDLKILSHPNMKQCLINLI